MLILSLSAFAADRVPEDFASIQQAIDHGTAEVIEVAPGVWDGAIVDRRVTLQGEPGAVIVGGQRVGNARYGFGLTGDADGTAIRGFVFDCRSNRLHLGVYASRSRMPGDAADNVVVSDNRFRGCTQGVTNTGTREHGVNGGENWVVERNTFRGIATRGIHTDGGGIGVYIYNAVGADIVENRFTGHIADKPRFSTTGVGLAGCWDCVVAANHFAMTGGQHHWTAVNNLGAAQVGAAATDNLVLTGNDAAADARPRGVNFRSQASTRVTADHNLGETAILP